MRFGLWFFVRAVAPPVPDKGQLCASRRAASSPITGKFHQKDEIKTKKARDADVRWLVELRFEQCLTKRDNDTTSQRHAERNSARNAYRAQYATMP